MTKISVDISPILRMLDDLGILDIFHGKSLISFQIKGENPIVIRKGLYTRPVDVLESYCPVCERNLINTYFKDDEVESCNSEAIDPSILSICDTCISIIGDPKNFIENHRYTQYFIYRFHTPELFHKIRKGMVERFLRITCQSKEV